MIDLLAVYICPNCGEILEDMVMDYTIIDAERDDVWTEKSCICGRNVTQKLIDGQPCFQSVDHERWLWATGFYDSLLEEF